MNDDELGRFLRGEVPAPGPGYWEQIDARLQDAAGDGAVSEVSEEVLASSQTDDTVVRLTDMNDTTSSTPNRFVGLMAVAAVLALIVGLAVVLTQDDSDDPDLDIAVPGVDDTPEDPPIGTLPAIGDEPDPGATDGLPEGVELLGRVEVGMYLAIEETPVRLEPRLDSPSEITLAVGTGVQIDGNKYLANGIEWFVSLTSQGDRRWVTADTVIIDSDDVSGETLSDTTPGVFLVIGEPVSVRANPGYDARVTGTIDPNTRVEITGSRVLADAEVWLEIASAAFEGKWLSQIGTQRDGTDDLDEGFELLSDTRVDTYELAEDTGPANLRREPGLVSEVVDTAVETDELHTTGRRAVASGLEWFEVQKNDDTSTAWIASQLLRPAATDVSPDELCYTDGDSVLVLDFSDDTITFTGAFSYLDSIEAVAGTRVADEGAIFDVNSSPIGSAEENGDPIVTEERWMATGEGMSVGERAMLPVIDCAEIADDFATLSGLVDTYPPFPS